MGNIVTNIKSDKEMAGDIVFLSYHVMSERKRCCIMTMLGKFYYSTFLEINKFLSFNNQSRNSTV